MHCRQCSNRIGSDWLEWRQRHAVRVSEHPYNNEIVVIEQVVLCAPPRVCAQEFAEATTQRASKIAHREAEEEPF